MTPVDGHRILIVEDDAPTSELLAEILAMEGYDPVVTGSAFGASALLRRVRPDAVVLDLGLPYRSGASLLRDLKADPRTASIPVVVVSGMPEALTGERQSLAAAVLQKPLDLQRLLNVVQQALQAQQARTG
jgi:DNA-binding response OmpR family regulator